MKLPKLNHIDTKRDVVDTFRGYNHNVRINEAEFYDEQNMTADYFPTLSPRDERGVYVPSNTDTNRITGISAGDKLCSAQNPHLYIGSTKIADFFGNSTAAPRHFVQMGAYLIAFPDKKYINTLNITDKGTLDLDFEQEIDTKITFRLCDENGKILSVRAVDQAPANQDVYWLDISDKENGNYTLNKYFEEQDGWYPVKAYTRISEEKYDDSSSASFLFADKVNGYDFIDPRSANGHHYAVRHSSNATSYYTFATADRYRVVKVDEIGKYVVVEGLVPLQLDISLTSTNNVKVATASAHSYAESGQEVLTISPDNEAFKATYTIPEMDFVIESGNRLWGCRYDAENKINEIYASKLGDFRNWSTFDGVSTDAYTASVGTDGPWTGAITYNGYPTFFKEKWMHKVYGEMPSNFQIQQYAINGVQSGCDRSLVIVNNQLFYKARDGVQIYDGALPYKISDPLGDINYSDAAAGTIRGKYYISMQDDAGAWHMFVYDTNTRLWHREDDTHAVGFATYNDDLYFIDEVIDDNNLTQTSIRTVRGTCTTGYGKEDKVAWMCESGEIGTGYVDKKRITRLILRMALDIGTNVNIFIQYDSRGEWQHVGGLIGTTLRSFSLPIRPRRCDHFKLRIEGVGKAKIFSIAKEIKQGSDR